MSSAQRLVRQLDQIDAGVPAGAEIGLALGEAFGVGVWNWGQHLAKRSAKRLGWGLDQTSG